MPTKFKPDGFEYKGTKHNRKATVVKNYIKATSKQVLIDYVNSSSGKPKIKQKCVNELTRRGIKRMNVSGEKDQTGLDLRGMK